MPELTGFNILRVDGVNKWLAVRFTSHGQFEVLTPMRNGEHVGESKLAATSTVMHSQRIELGSKR